MTEINFYEPAFTPESKLIYSVIAAKYCDCWLYVRHRKRTTWEIPGGHIEENESPEQAARRELTEETGAIDFNLECVATYSVCQDKRTTYGRLYLAEVSKLGPFPDRSEIEEIKKMAGLPDNLTYQVIQPVLFEKVISFIKTRSGV
jgi:8-oxo-dGTP diphosphatase